MNGAKALLAMIGDRSLPRRHDAGLPQLAASTDESRARSRSATHPLTGDIIEEIMRLTHRVPSPSKV